MCWRSVRSTEYGGGRELLWKNLWVFQEATTSAVFSTLVPCELLVGWVNLWHGFHLLGFYFALYCLVSGLGIAGVFPVPFILHCVHHSCDSFSQQCHHRRELLSCAISFFCPYRITIFSWICFLSLLKNASSTLRNACRRPLQVKYSKEHSLVCNKVSDTCKGGVVL